MKINFSKLVILLTILHIDLFVVGLFILNLCNSDLSDTAITCFFTFWGVEVLSLAGIRVCKSRYNKDYEKKLEKEIEEE